MTGRSKMKKGKISVTYILHSGFLVETDQSYLLFDYWKGTLPPLDAAKKLYVFSSHNHHDHYTKEIFRLEHRCRETFYILSKDIKRSSSFWRIADTVCFLNPGECADVSGCHVEAYYSTDEGVAFLVDIDGYTLFHAGDLHWWDWPGEPEEENEQMRIDYCAQIDLLKDRHIDVAFVVVDPRQEGSGGWGLEYFADHVEADFVFPMHFWEDYAYVHRTYEGLKDHFKEGQFREISSRGQCFVLG